MLGQDGLNVEYVLPFVLQCVVPHLSHAPWLGESAKSHNVLVALSLEQNMTMRSAFEPTWPGPPESAIVTASRDGIP